MNRHFLMAMIAAFAMLSFAMTAHAAELLNVQQIELTKKGEVTPGLEEIAAIIRRGLPYEGCRLIDQQSCRLPANATLNFKGDYQLVFKTLEDGKISVTIQRKKKLLLSISITIDGTEPVVVGGFNSGNSKRVFVMRKTVVEEQKN